jgi:hypothetical protein
VGNISQVRLEPQRQAYGAPALDADNPAKSTGGGEGGEEKEANRDAEPATSTQGVEGAKAPTETPPVASAASESKLNPDAAPFVPSSSSGDVAVPAEEDKHDDDDDDDDDEDDDDGAEGGDDGASEATKATEGNDGPLVEVTRWAERGVGQLRLLVHKPMGAGDKGILPYPRLVMRVEHVGRLILNESLLPSMAPAERVTDTSIRFVLVSATQGPQSYLVRVKTPVEAEGLLSRLNATIPHGS